MGADIGYVEWAISGHYMRSVSCCPSDGMLILVLPAIIPM
jgi:hypothetical protein